MQRDADTLLSNNERAFITEALVAECRLDGRGLYDFRKLKFEFSLDDSSATLQLGLTRVMAVISATLEAPFPDRPSEGNIRFNVECGPMASPAFEPGRPGLLAVQLARLVERALKQSGAVDAEALCVIAGRKVWALRCDVHVLDHGGNLVDACVLAALAAFMAFRRPEVTLGGDTGTQVVVHPKEQREPLPLTIHHHPVAVTWAVFQTPGSGTVCAVDPSLREQAAQDGSATFIVNTSREVCGVQKADGLGLTTPEVMRLVRLSCAQAETLVGALRAALQAHEVARVAARVRRADAPPGLPAVSRHVSVSTAATAQRDTPGSQPPPSSAKTMETDADSSSEDADTSSGSSSEGDPGDTQKDARPVAPAAASSPGPSGQRPVASSKGTVGKTAAAAPAAQTVGKQLQKPSPKRTAQRRDSQGDVVQRAAPHAAFKVDDNLETIAALIAGVKPGEAPDPTLDLTAAVKQDRVAHVGKKKGARSKGTSVATSAVPPSDG